MPAVLGQLPQHAEVGDRTLPGIGELTGGVGSVRRVIATLAVENYRSLRRLIVPLAQLTVVTGANGTGKSSLYRTLRLLADAARNGAVAARGPSRTRSAPTTAC